MERKELDSDTKQLTLQLFNAGKPINEIATSRKLSVSTIENHLAYYISIDKLNLNKIVPLTIQNEIKKAVQQFGTASLKVLKENVSPEITYGEIRMTLTSIQNTDNQ